MTPEALTPFDYSELDALDAALGALAEDPAPEGEDE